MAQCLANAWFKEEIINHDGKGSGKKIRYYKDLMLFELQYYHRRAMRSFVFGGLNRTAFLSNHSLQHLSLITFLWRCVNPALKETESLNHPS